ncbi:MAG: pyrroline-5-carboxylate reductase [Phycisphaeraceae bacterium]
MQYTLGLIGAGNMAEAIVRAAIGQGVIPAEKIIAADPSPDRRAVFASLGAAVAESNREVVAGSDQLLLAVKPQMFPEVAGELGGGPEEQVFISIMAGLGTAKIAAAVPGRSPRVVRVMPNTPVLVGQGMAGIALGEHARPGDEELAIKLFSAGGEAVRVGEAQMDAITAVSGSGPAYAFYLAEAMQQAAEELGLGEHAGLLVSQTLLGAARMLRETGESPAELRRKVTSPGGTTEAACHTLDAKQVRESVVAAVKAAAARSEELGR